jgi:hypothetical protein
MSLVCPKNSTLSVYPGYKNICVSKTVVKCSYGTLNNGLCKGPLIFCSGANSTYVNGTCQQQADGLCDPKDKFDPLGRLCIKTGNPMQYYTPYYMNATCSDSQLSSDNTMCIKSPEGPTCPTGYSFTDGNTTCTKTSATCPTDFTLNNDGKCTKDPTCKTGTLKSTITNGVTTFSCSA